MKYINFRILRKTAPKENLKCSLFLYNDKSWAKYYYGLFEAVITITDDGELKPLGNVILLLLAGCAYALMVTPIITSIVLLLLFKYTLQNLRNLSTNKQICEEEAKEILVEGNENRS